MGKGRGKAKVAELAGAMILRRPAESLPDGMVGCQVDAITTRLLDKK
jgi:hypothetical protein